MRPASTSRLVGLVAASALVLATSSACSTSDGSSGPPDDVLPASTAPTPTAPTAPPTAPTPGAADWRGDRTARPSSYDWLGPYTPSDTYDIVLVQGLSPRAVLRTLGPVNRDLGPKTPRQAESYVVKHDWRSVVQVAPRGRVVVLYVPYNFVSGQDLARLSRRGLAAGFSTTVEYDTYVEVARRGRVIRRFDAGFRPPRKGALTEEKGLDWGSRRQNIWATAWALNERLTRTHLSREWFEQPHPTYVLRDPLL